jgi:hypothetical protein
MQIYILLKFFNDKIKYNEIYGILLKVLNKTNGQM